MAFDSFLKLDTITGESTDKTFAGNMEIFSFSMGVSNPVTISSTTTGAGGGKATFSGFNFMKKTDSASPILFNACVKGSHIATGTLSLRKAGGDAALPYLIYGFKVLFVDSIQWSGSSGGDDSPMESVSFSFGTWTVDYQAQDNTGAAKGGAIHGGWSVQTNQPV